MWSSYSASQLETYILDGTLSASDPAADDVEPYSPQVAAQIGKLLDGGAH